MLVIWYNDWYMKFLDVIRGTKSVSKSQLRPAGAFECLGARIAQTVKLSGRLGDCDAFVTVETKCPNKPDGVSRSVTLGEQVCGYGLDSRAELSDRLHGIIDTSRPIDAFAEELGCETCILSAKGLPRITRVSIDTLGLLSHNGGVRIDEDVIDTTVQLRQLEC